MTKDIIRAYLLYYEDREMNHTLCYFLVVTCLDELIESKNLLPELKDTILCYYISLCLAHVEPK